VPPLPAEAGGTPPPGGYWVPSGGGYGQPPAPPQRRALGSALIYLVVAVLAAAAGAGAVLALRAGSPAPAQGPASPQDIPSPRATPPGGAAGSGLNRAAVAAKVDPGLADITSFVHLQQQVFEGTGMVLNRDGLVLTNNHVIKGSTLVKVRLVATGRSYVAQVVGTDNAQDVALLRLKGASGLTPVQVGDSSKVTKGTPVVALGNAGGTGGLPQVSTGQITALHRAITASDAGSGTSEKLTNMFQTNAPIAEGDSGGALANAAGQVIAMNTAANSQSLGSASSEGFSIPINRALGIARLIAGGHAGTGIQIGLPPFLGIAIASSPHQATSTAASPQAQWHQLQQIAAGTSFGGVNSSGRCLHNATMNPVPASIAPATSGTLIGAVFCREPAAAAGAQAGDVITALDGHTVTSPASLHAVISQYHPGTTVSLSVVALGGQRQTLSLTLAAGPAA
jgi:S1-C subfamily serine protease